MKYKVPGFLGGHVYSTWEEAYNNCPDGREGMILVEMTIIEYAKLMKKIESQTRDIYSQTEEIKQLKYVINNIEFENREKKKELIEKDRRCASLAAAVNRLKGKKQKGGVV